MTEKMTASCWCTGGPDLVQLLTGDFGRDNVLIRSPHHLQVRQQAALHNLWIDSQRSVKYRLSDQAGGAVVAASYAELVRAIRGHDTQQTDLAQMRRALELPVLIDRAKQALPWSGLTRAVFVDAGFSQGKAQIGVVLVAMEKDGEYVRAESRPSTAQTSDAAESAAIDYALSWVGPDVVIWCDNQAAVQRAQQHHGERVRWLPREHNRCADRVASLRHKRKRKRRRGKKGKQTPK